LDTLKYWVWLALAFGAANHRVWELTIEFENVESAYKALKTNNLKGVTEKEKQSIKTTHIEQAEKIIEYCNNNQISIISYEDESYPARLREIYNPPVVLYCYGDLSFVDNSIALGVVGAREPSDYGVNVAENICSELARVGTVLVSGFAYGIDSIAHKCALVNHSKTIAVLAGGVDYDYPVENAKLKKILAKNGAVISEYPPGTKPFFEFFRQRNRLISALSLGVLIIEASSKSGSLNTASHALQQGKDIFCIPPHDIFDEKYSGVISLLRDGAIPVFSHLDILYEYYDNYSHKLKENKMFENYLITPSNKSEQKQDIFNKDDFTKSIIKEKAEKNTKPDAHQKTHNDYSHLSEVQSKIIELLKDKTLLVDDIICELQLDVSVVLMELTELELNGLIKSLAGKRYSL